MKIRGPMVTLAAVAALGVGIWLVQCLQGGACAAGQACCGGHHDRGDNAGRLRLRHRPRHRAPPAAAFPAKADYVGKIPTANGTITLDITIEGDKAVAYACDGNTIESWLRGSAANGALSLANKDKTSRLEGRLEGNAVVGTLWIGEKKWDFKADPAQPPAGLYVYENAGVRNSWIIDGDGGVTGVQRRPDGSTAPAPGLSIDRTAVIDGQTIVATRVEGASDV